MSNIKNKSSVIQLTTYEAGIAQANVHRQLQKHCDVILSKYGITKMHWVIIGLIYDHKDQGITISDLARSIGTGLPYLTNTINLLESKKIIVKTNAESDSRVKIVTLTQQFSNKVPEIEDYLRKSLKQTIYADVSPDDFKTYLKVLLQLSDKFKD